MGIAEHKKKILEDLDIINLQILQRKNIIDQIFDDENDFLNLSSIEDESLNQIEEMLLDAGISEEAAASIIDSIKDTYTQNLSSQSDIPKITPVGSLQDADALNVAFDNLKLQLLQGVRNGSAPRAMLHSTGNKLKSIVNNIRKSSRSIDNSISSINTLNTPVSKTSIIEQSANMNSLADDLSSLSSSMDYQADGLMTPSGGDSSAYSSVSKVGYIIPETYPHAINATTGAIKQDVIAALQPSIKPLVATVLMKSIQDELGDIKLNTACAKIALDNISTISTDNLKEAIGAFIRTDSGKKLQLAADSFSAISDAIGELANPQDAETYELSQSIGDMGVEMFLPTPDHVLASQNQQLLSTAQGMLHLVDTIGLIDSLNTNNYIISEDVADAIQEITSSVNDNIDFDELIELIESTNLQIINAVSESSPVDTTSWVDGLLDSFDKFNDKLDDIANVLTEFMSTEGMKGVLENFQKIECGNVLIDFDYGRLNDTVSRELKNSFLYSGIADTIDKIRGEEDLSPTIDKDTYSLAKGARDHAKSGESLAKAKTKNLDEMKKEAATKLEAIETTRAMMETTLSSIERSQY